MNPEQKGDITELEPVDEAGRQAAIDAFHTKAQEQADKVKNATEIKQAPMNSLKENMVVAIVFKDKNGATWIHPSMFRIKGVWANGRVNLKVIKRH